MKTNWLLEHHFVRGDYAFCKKIIQELTKKNDGRQREYSAYVQARIYLAEGQIQEGLQLFQVCYSQDSNNPGYLKEIAKCLIAQSRYKKAVEALTHTRRLTSQPDFNLFYDLARCYTNLKEYSLAEDSCKEAIKICKSKPVYKLLAVCLIQQNKIGEAIEVFRLALRMFPKSSQLYTSFGKLCARMNFEEDALKTLAAAIKLDDSNVTALTELAVLHQKRGELDESINLYREILYRGGESASVFNNLGLCYFYKDKFVLALTCLLKARDINPLCVEAFFNLGLIFACLHQHCSAVIHWKTTGAFTIKSEDQESTVLVSECLKVIDGGYHQKTN